MKGSNKLAELLTGPKPKPEAVPEEIEASEDSIEDLGSCAAVARYKSTMALTIKHPGGYESFQYRDITVRCEYKPTEFTIGFADAYERYRLTITGRNLERIYTLITQARLEWLRADPRGEFAEDGKPVITKVAVERVEEKRG